MTLDEAWEEVTWLYFAQHAPNPVSTCLMGGPMNMIGKCMCALTFATEILPNIENSSDIVALRYVVDGNFTAQHMKMRRPEDDVWLSDGLAYMVANRPYGDHVSKAADNEEVYNIYGSLLVQGMGLTGFF